jgi:hypothetical protein
MRLPVPPAPGGAGAPEQAAGAAPPPPPAEAPDVQAKREIMALLERYRAANEARDLDTLRQVYPTVHPSVVETLKGLTSLEYHYVGEPRYIELQPGRRAVIEVRTRQVYELQTGSRPPSETIARVTLTKVNAQNRWLIESIIHRRPD